MKKLNFAICDLETGYAERLTEYISERQNIPFQILAFSGIESLKTFAKDHEIELLLISSRMMCPQVRAMDIRRTIILSEGEVVREYQDYPSVYKYQSSDSLVAEVMEAYVKEADDMAPLFMQRNACIYGIYSPIGRCGKTSFALTLGQILAETQTTLYLNLEECAGFSDLLEKEYKADLTDLMYFIRQNKGNILFKLNSLTQKIGKLDYIPPAYFSSDLSDVKSEEWLRLLGNITSLGGYECVVLDLGGTVEERLPILSFCDEIFTPTCEGKGAAAKIRQYEKQLKELDFGELLQKTRYLQLPHSEIGEGGEYAIQQLVWTELGEYVRSTILKKAEA